MQHLIIFILSQQIHPSISRCARASPLTGLLHHSSSSVCSDGGAELLFSCVAQQTINMFLATRGWNPGQHLVIWVLIHKTVENL